MLEVGLLHPHNKLNVETTDRNHCSLLALLQIPIYIFFFLTLLFLNRKIGHIYD